MPHALRQKKSLAIGAVVVLLAAAGAYAYWTTTGSGTGDVTHASTQAVTINQATPLNTLFPGVDVPLSGTFTNPNTGPATVTSVTVTIASVTDPTPGTPACTAADYAITDNVSTVTDGTVTPGAANGAWSGLTLSMLDSATNQDQCKDATVNLAYASL